MTAAACAYTVPCCQRLCVCVYCTSVFVSVCCLRLQHELAGGPGDLAHSSRPRLPRYALPCPVRVLLALSYLGTRTLVASFLLLGLLSCYNFLCFPSHARLVSPPPPGSGSALYGYGHQNRGSRHLYLYMEALVPEVYHNSGIRCLASTPLYGLGGFATTAATTC